ncbi:MULTISPECIES: hypothetical protein [unclassified Acidovorax]|uniref:hypothetical protein n=1 Tax=unclassified Acidovorax TaxID=2684926 RepID=UPI0012E1E68E|nr:MULTISPECIES: hypothetical protein [unclassified Acidovorax]
MRTSTPGSTVNVASWSTVTSPCTVTGDCAALHTVSADITPLTIIAAAASLKPPIDKPRTTPAMAMDERMVLMIRRQRAVRSHGTSAKEKLPGTVGVCMKNFFVFKGHEPQLRGNGRPA